MKNTIVIILILAGLLLLGYWYYSGPKIDPNALLIQTGAGVGDTGSMIGQKTITLLQQLEKVNIDRSIFSTAAFQSLEDFGVEIRPEPVGRPDPFAPVGFEGGAAVFSGTATSSFSR